MRIKIEYSKCIRAVRSNDYATFEKCHKDMPKEAKEVVRTALENSLTDSSRYHDFVTKYTNGLKTNYRNVIIPFVDWLRNLESEDAIDKFVYALLKFEILDWKKFLSEVGRKSLLWEYCGDCCGDCCVEFVKLLKNSYLKDAHVGEMLKLKSKDGLALFISPNIGIYGKWEFITVNKDGRVTYYFFNKGIGLPDPSTLDFEEWKEKRLEESKIDPFDKEYKEWKEKK